MATRVASRVWSDRVLTAHLPSFRCAVSDSLQNIALKDVEVRAEGLVTPQSAAS